MATTSNHPDLESGDLSHAARKDSETYQSTVLPASAADFDPEPHKRLLRQFANPAPLGLCGFALTTFVLSLVNVQARSVTTPNIVIGLGISSQSVSWLIDSTCLRWPRAILCWYVGIRQRQHLWCPCLFLLRCILD